MARTSDDIPGAMRRYERARRRRTRAGAARRAAQQPGLPPRGAEAVLRNLYLRTIGGKMLLRRYDWLYDWRPLPPK